MNNAYALRGVQFPQEDGDEDVPQLLNEVLVRNGGACARGFRPASQVTAKSRTSTLGWTDSYGVTITTPTHQGASPPHSMFQTSLKLKG
jgi:hypothetical protein